MILNQFKICKFSLRDNLEEYQRTNFLAWCHLMSSDRGRQGQFYIYETSETKNQLVELNPDKILKDDGQLLPEEHNAMFERKKHINWNG